MSKFNKLSLNDIKEDGFIPMSKSKSEASTSLSAKKPFAMSIPPRDPLADYFKFIDFRSDIYVQRLKEAVAIRSVSAWPDHRPEIFKMLNWTKDWITRFGGTASLYDNPCVEQVFDDGSKIPLPPILLGQFGSDPAKKTVCVYGHLDVQVSERSERALSEECEATNPLLTHSCSRASLKMLLAALVQVLAGHTLTGEETLHVVQRCGED